MFRFRKLFYACAMMMLSAAAVAADAGNSGADAASHVSAVKLPLEGYQGFWLLFVYVVAIAALPIFATIYDTNRTYAERKLILDRLPDKATPAEVEQMFKVMNTSGPSGFTGLTRGILAVTLLLILAIPVLHFGVLGIDMPKSVSELVMLLAGSLTSVTGFYFGTKAARDAAAKPDPKPAVSTAPKIKSIDPKTAAGGAPVTVKGEQFGDEPGKVYFDKVEATVPAKDWSDTEITVTVPTALKSGTVAVTVKTKEGATSAPYEIEIP